MLKYSYVSTCINEYKESFPHAKGLSLRLFLAKFYRVLGLTRSGRCFFHSQLPLIGYSERGFCSVLFRYFGRIISAFLGEIHKLKTYCEQYHSIRTEKITFFDFCEK
jgi:hypothetical protein